MSRYKRYERYKDSGVEWIGEIPEHWNNKKISWIFNIIGSGTTPSTSNLEYYDGDVPWVNTGDLNDGYLYETSKMITDLALKDYSTLKFYPIDTLLIAMYGATIGKLSITKIIATTNQACCALAQPKNVNIKFIFYWFLANRNHIIAMAYGGGQPNISQNLIKSLRINLPEKHEQNAIVNFLDQKTAVIDGLIADKEKLIELLQEKRQAIITEAVTKGLNPNVKMKDSGIEWIGEIPEHWSIIKMKYLLSSKKYSIKAGPFGSQLKNDDMVSGDIKVYNQKTVLDNDFKSGDYYIENCKYEELRAFEVFSGDLLVTTRGTIGKTAIVPKDAEKGILHPCLIKITLNPDKVLNDYVNVIFNNTKIVTNQIMLESNATTIDVIYTDTLKNLVLPIPPLEEQKSIIDFVDAKIGEIDGLISSINNQIQKLKEYRQSLISEAVTGKIDVRVFENKDEVIYSEQDSSPCRELTHVAE